MKYLLVVAHPDDEVLGAGASIYKWCKDGDTVDVAIMCTEAKARAFFGDLKLLYGQCWQYSIPPAGNIHSGCMTALWSIPRRHNK